MFPIYLVDHEFNFKFSKQILKRDLLFLIEIFKKLFAEIKILNN